MERFIIEQASRFNMDKTVETILQTAIKKGWSIPATHDLQQSLAKSGKQVKPVKVIEICKPEYSGKMLELNDERIISVMMPCRISVYEKNDGKTYVAILNSGMMTQGVSDSVAKAIQAAFNESMGIVKSVLD
jgi:uncharacterized protein (DUF302 family)